MEEKPTNIDEELEFGQFDEILTFTPKKKKKEKQPDLSTESLLAGSLEVARKGLEKIYPDIKGMSDEEFNNWLSDNYDQYKSEHPEENEEA